MRAAQIHAYGPPEVLRVEEVPDPRPGPKDVLIEVHASSVNPVDYKIRYGYQRGVIWYKMPRILGMDVSGVVREVGAEVTDFAPGDEVWSSPHHLGGGTYAEMVAVNAREVARKPERLSHLEAATIPLVGLTVWQCLVDKAALQAGERALIQAGSGGVGTFAIQLAKHLGAHVTTTCSPRNFDLVKGLGADEVINYREQGFDEVLEPRSIDVFLHAVGPEDRKRGLTVLKKGGRHVSIDGGIPARAKKVGAWLAIPWTGLSLVGFKLRATLAGRKSAMVTRKPLGAQLAEIAAIVDAGGIDPVIDKTFPLDEIAEAHRYIETGRASGKIAIAIR